MTRARRSLTLACSPQTGRARLADGWLYRLKGYPEGVPNVTMRIDARRPAVTITPYARPDGRGFFMQDRVWIEDGAGRIVDERDQSLALESPEL